MQILYLSVLTSKKVLEEAARRDSRFAGYAVQKFHKLLTQGLVQNGAKVKALSTFYQPTVGRYWHHRSDSDNGVCFRYIPSPNLGRLRHVWLVIYCFFCVLRFGLLGRKDKVLVCDVLNISACLGAVAAARLVGLRRVGIMTDMPGLMVSRSNSEKTRNDSGEASFTTKMNKSFLSRFTHYVFLTEQMNNAINIQHRPYIIIEGLVDANMPAPEAKADKEKHVVLYAGGLHERYGLKMLTDAFVQTDAPDAELWLYGNGPFADLLPEYEHKDSRIHYWGIQPNDVIVEAERKATLLVNPRPTHEEFTQYSFPSKNMEYMVSGTPLLTTKLPGMPKEYYPYVYLFDEETTEGYAKMLNELLSLSPDDLATRGLEAQQWVLKHKSNVVQAERLMNFIDEK